MPPNAQSYPLLTGAAASATIVYGEVATSVGTDGRAISPQWQFSAAADRRIVAIVTLNNLPAGTELSYVRYLNGRFVDSKSSKLTKASSTLDFEFDAVGGKQFSLGDYRLRLYVNQRATWELRYQIA